MRRRECGIVRDGGAPTTAPGRGPEPVGPLRPALSEAPSDKEKARRMVRWPVRRATQPARTAAQDARRPVARQVATGLAAGDPSRTFAGPVAIGARQIPASPQRWVTMSAHRGFRGASLKHRARNAGIPAESRHTFLD
jgi:hypothetical protein